VGISLSGLSREFSRQLSLMDDDPGERADKLDDALFRLQKRYDPGIVKTGSELSAERRTGDGDW